MSAASIGLQVLAGAQAATAKAKAATASAPSPQTRYQQGAMVDAQA